MPDADDFDVEYFRNLLKGGRPQEPAPPTAPPTAPPAPAKAGPRRSAHPSAAGKKSKPAVRRKRDGNR